MGLYCVFDGLSRAGVGVAGPASAELLSGTCPTPTILKLQAVFRVSQEVQATVPEPIKPAMPALGQTSARLLSLRTQVRSWLTLLRVHRRSKDGHMMPCRYIDRTHFF